jgi:hypothetical protein
VRLTWILNQHIQISTGRVTKNILKNVIEIPNLKTLGDALFFVLFKLKNDMICGSFGLVFGMSEAAAHRNFNYFPGLSEETLEKKK